jgi:WD40 repeat protein
MPDPQPTDTRAHDASKVDGQAPTLPPTESAPFETGLAHIPGYDVLAELGRGGMGVVYKAHHKNLNRVVALKMILAGSHAGPLELARFRQEAETAARLQHPNIVQVYEVSSHAGLSYLALEYVDGGSLAKKTAGIPQPVREAARLVELLARAVDHAHQNGIIHRDLTPGNVLLTADGAPKLTDFGLARSMSDAQKMTATGAIVGTPGYLAPEQAQASKVAIGPATDIHALGAILFSLLTGRPPFQAATPLETILQTIDKEAVRPMQLRPDTPVDLETICLKCLQKEPSRRYATAADLADDLRRFLADEPIRARPVGAAERAWKWVRRNPALASAAAAVVLVLVVGAAVSTGFALVARREADRAAANEILANEKAREAAADRDAARAAERIGRQRMVGLNRLTGILALDIGEPAAALLWFHQAWELDEPEGEPSHRARLAGLLQSMPELVGACFHPGQVCDAAFSPDGTRLLTRSNGPEVYLWDFAQSRLVAPPLTHGGPVRHACWSPDGSTVATASADGSAGVWDAKSGARRHTLTHGKAVNWVAYHPGGNRLVTAGEDGIIRLWEATTGKALDGQFPVGAAVDHVAFSGDGTRLVTAGRDDTVRGWKVDPPGPLSPPLPYKASTPTERYQFHFHRWPRFGADGRSLISFKGDDLIVWPGEGTEFKKFNVGYKITEIHPIPGTDRVLATGNKYNRVAVLRVSDGKDVYVLSHPRQANVGAVSPDGKYLITASSGGLIHLRDSSTGQLIWPPQKCGDFASAVAVSADGKRCLAASQDGTVRVWAVRPQYVEVLPYKPDGRANNLVLAAPGERTRAFSPDGKQVVEYGGDGPAQFGPAGGTPTRAVDHPEAVVDVLFGDDGNRFVVFGRDVVRVWNARSGVPAGPPVKVHTEGRGIGIDRLGRLSRDGARVAAWDDERTVSVWDLIAGRRVFGPVKFDDPGPRIFGPPEGNGHITGLILSANGRQLAAATDSSGALTVWDVDSGRIAHHTLKRFQGYAQGFAFSADSRRILLWASDNNARVYNASTGEPIGPAINPPLSKELYVRVHPNECAISADGRWLVFFEGGLGAIRLYDARWADSLLRVELPADLLRVPPGAKSPISRMWFSPDGARISLIAGGKPSTIILPRFEVPTEATGPLVRFLTGQRIDATDGAMDRVDPAAFRTDPAVYRRAFLAWKGLADDPAAQPPLPAR